MSHVAVIGCGIVGAAIAYELSLVPGLKITVLDQYPPAQGSTGAALGVLMGAISKKVKGRAWQLRQASMQRYETLIPELEAITGHQIPFNRKGILMLCFAEEDLATWQPLLATRQSQGWHLEIWDKTEIQSYCPQVCNNKIIGAVYSPQDRQVDPTALTLALVAAAAQNGVTFKFGVAVEEIKSTVTDTSALRSCHQIHTRACFQTSLSNLDPPQPPFLRGENLLLVPLVKGDLRGSPDQGDLGGSPGWKTSPKTEQLDVDWLVVASGLGSSQLTASLQQPIDIKPVLGQALHLRAPLPLGNPEFQPVITGDDVHIVPVGDREYWVGATVEFPNQAGEVVAEPALLDKLREAASSFCPALAEATILGTWFGKRPRPEGRPAPIIGHLPGYSNILLATGHYRNGVLLAPATAQAIREMIKPHFS